MQQVIQAEGLIYMVLECGDIDLARLLVKHEQTRREGGAEDIDENFIRLYWQQMLQVCHSPCTAATQHCCLEQSPPTSPCQRRRTCRT